MREGRTAEQMSAVGLDGEVCAREADGTDVVLVVDRSGGGRGSALGVHRARLLAVRLSIGDAQMETDRVDQTPLRGIDSRDRVLPEQGTRTTSPLRKSQHVATYVDRCIAIGHLLARIITEIRL